MKNRKLVIVAFLLVATLTMGIGYAALTAYLNVHGGATVSVKGAENAFNQDIVFTEATVAANSTDKCTASVGDGKTASFEVSGLQGAGDFVEMTYKIENKGDLDATIAIDAANTTNSAATFFAVTTPGWNDGQTLNPGQSVYITVKVELLHTPTDPTTPLTGDFLLRLVATSTEENTLTPIV